MNLLTHNTFRVKLKAGADDISLPALLEALGAGKVDDYLGLQRHQAEPFHVFLCSLAAIVLSRRKAENPVQTALYWKSGLTEIAGRFGEDAWEMFVDDDTQPAFMQPPLPSAQSETGRRAQANYRTPDELDLLITAKNHDLKMSRQKKPHIDEWVYALISLQTMSGYCGKGHYGISRMNSGFGNRSIVEIAQSLEPNQRWRDAVLRLMAHRAVLLRRPFGYRDDGIALAWTEPWDGVTPLPLTTLDPLFIEVCRRIRLGRDSGNGEASGWHYPVKAMRIAATAFHGNVGDAWLPIDLAKGAAFTASATGFSPKELRRIVFQDSVVLSALQRPLAGWQGPAWLKLSVLVRGQGRTDGYHERTIMLPPAVQPKLFGNEAARAPLADLSKAMIDCAEKTHQALKIALFTKFQGGPAQTNIDRKAQAQWWRRYKSQFDLLWTTDYFPHLWQVPEAFDQEEEQLKWVRILQNYALQVLNLAMDETPQRSGQRHRAIARSFSAFFGVLYSPKFFPRLLK